MTTSLVSATRISTPTRGGGLRYIPTVAFGTDLVVITLSVFAAILGRSTIPFPMSEQELQIGDSLSVAGPLMIMGWVAAIFALGGYRPKVFGAGLDEYKSIVNGSLLTAAAVGISCYLVQFELSRGFFVLAFAIGIPMLVLGRFLLRRSVHRARAHGALQHRVVIAGSEGHVDEIASVLRRETWLGYHVVGALTPDPQGRSTTHSGIPLLGSSNAIAATAIDAEADIVFLAGAPWSSATDMRRLAWDLEHEDVPGGHRPERDRRLQRADQRPPGRRAAPDPPGEAALRGRRTPRQAHLRHRRVARACCSLFAPVFLFAALRIWAHDRGPVFFGQSRVGRDNDAFRCWKFRTMVTNAEELLADLHKQHGYEGGLFKIEDDPRITAPGKWMRRFSLDELPQLFNVLRGDMSLVGPRPPLHHEVAKYDDDVRPPAARPSRHDRAVAGLRPLRPLLVRSDPARPLLRRQLVDVPGPHDPGPHLQRRLRLPRRLLTQLPCPPSRALEQRLASFSRGLLHFDRPRVGTMTAAV